MFVYMCACVWYTVVFNCIQMSFIVAVLDAVSRVDVLSITETMYAISLFRTSA